MVVEGAQVVGNDINHIEPIGERILCIIHQKQLEFGHEEVILTVGFHGDTTSGMTPVYQCCGSFAVKSQRRGLSHERVSRWGQREQCLSTYLGINVVVLLGPIYKRKKVNIQNQTK